MCCLVLLQFLLLGAAPTQVAVSATTASDAPATKGKAVQHFRPQRTLAPGCEALEIAKAAGGSARTKDIAQHQARRPHVAILHAAESVQVVGLVKAAFQFTAGLRLQKLTLDRIEILSPETSPA